MPLSPSPLTWVLLLSAIALGTLGWAIPVVVFVVMAFALELVLSNGRADSGETTGP